MINPPAQTERSSKQPDQDQSSSAPILTDQERADAAFLGLGCAFRSVHEVSVSEYRRHGHLLVKLGQSLHERLPLLRMTALQVIQQTLSRSLWTTPSLKTFPVTLIAGLDLGQSHKSTAYLGAQITEINLDQSGCLAGWDA
jgi:hypothetical protein